MFSRLFLFLCSFKRVFFFPFTMSTWLCLCSQWLNQGHLDFRGFIPDHQGLYVNKWLKNASKLSTETTLSLRTHSGLWCDSMWSGIFRNVLLSAWHVFFSFSLCPFLSGWRVPWSLMYSESEGPAASEQWGQFRSTHDQEAPAGSGWELWRESPPAIHPPTAPRTSAPGAVRLLTNEGPLHNHKNECWWGGRERGPPCSVGGNGSWCSSSGEQSGVSSANWKQSYYMDPATPILVYTQKTLYFEKIYPPPVHSSTIYNNLDMETT